MTKKQTDHGVCLLSFFDMLAITFSFDSFVFVAVVLPFAQGVQQTYFSLQVSFGLPESEAVTSCHPPSA